MHIVLMRHGKPQIDWNVSVTAEGFGAWVRQYDAAGLDPGHPPSPDAVEHANRCAFTVCSDLPRSLQSAQTLGIEQVHVSDAMFREVAMPYAAWRFPRLAPMAWMVLFRLAWGLGYAGKGESSKAAKARARRCAAHLVELAARHGTVLFVGHGGLNWLIAKQLKRMGWSCPGKSPRKYWECSVYRGQT